MRSGPPCITRGYVSGKHHRPLKSVRCEVDVAFTRWRIAVMLDGCFWHSCPVHATTPALNGPWWTKKLEGNLARDRMNDSLLAKAGWLVLRFWEHDDTTEIVTKVIATLQTLGRVELPRS